MAEEPVEHDEPWRRPGGAATWFAPGSDAPSGTPTPTPSGPSDGLPGLTAPDRTVTWTPGEVDGAPGPGIAAPGRAGWARTSGTYVPAVGDKGATKAIILGVIGLFLCGVIFGPAAIVEGVKARRRIAASGGGLTGNARAIVGIGIGSVATFLASLGILAIVVEATRT